MARSRQASTLALVFLGSAIVAATMSSTAWAQGGPLPEPPGRDRPSRGPRMGGDHDYPPLEKVTEGYDKVVSTADGHQSMYTIWLRHRDGQMLAELPREFSRHKYFIALTVASGERYAGLQ